MIYCKLYDHNMTFIKLLLIVLLTMYSAKSMECVKIGAKLIRGRSKSSANWEYNILHNFYALALIIIIIIRMFDVVALYENESIPSHLTVTLAFDDDGISNHYIYICILVICLDFAKRFGKLYERQFARAFQFTVWTI